MTLEQIRKIARQRGVAPSRMKKAELIRAVQHAEGNYSCFETGQAAACAQQECLWRQDCQ
ncbi:SAP domain-containing protein [Desulfuromonas versatilis]|uniref:SAP domain-containing protein n=1 Tax=Desulfuromonas versatilis TaxID=2802975 RepID=A0ABM8I1B0_9BACT|nr:Rho termination factor N-terminal domain-containing protein [Desulfuromonas versatilis]BCR06817.1 SAP domain-containing protein [Desulfuromonas versatilis]